MISVKVIARPTESGVDLEGLMSTNAMLRSMLDGVTSCVMLADTDFRITYVNPAARQLFVRHAEQFAVCFPGFDPDTLEGQSMDLFHVSPEHQQRLLNNPARLPYRTSMNIGRVLLGLNVDVSRDAAGAMTGFVLEWKDHTARARYGDEIERLRQAAWSGELDRRGDVSRMQGRFADVLGAVNGTFDGMAELVGTLGDALGRAADGDLSVPVSGGLVGEYAEVGEQYNRMCGALSESLGQVREAATQIDAGSGQLSATARSVSAGAATQAAALDQVRATLGQVSTQAETTAVVAEEVDRMADRAGEAARRGDARTQAMVAAMAEIEAAGLRIARVITVIEEIAFQTNLLALNAAVEAARAGSHGQGFAVVAEEVRSLAARSSTAAHQTQDIVEQALARVEEGTTAAQETSRSIGQIVESIDHVRVLMTDIAAASAEQASGVSEVSAGLSEVDRVTHENTSSAHDSADAAERLAEEAGRLTELLAGFRLASPPQAMDPVLQGLSPEMLAAVRAWLAQADTQSVALPA